jgi:hypothetical protein
MGSAPPSGGHLGCDFAVQRDRCQWGRSQVILAPSPFARGAMPTSGLSLVGFLDEQPAIHHLRFVCMPADPSDVALRAIWQAARAQLGAPTANAGNPGVHPIPAAQQPHVDQVRQVPWVTALLQMHPGADFRMVDIGPLLAWQQTVDLARCDHHCGQAQAPPTVDDVFRICLPTTLDAVAPQVLPAPGALLIKARNGNLRITGWGGFTDKLTGANIAGIRLGISPSLVHVVRYNGKHYLHNGYHRTVALMRAGAPQVACLVRDASTPQDVGIKDDGGTFKVSQLEGPNPPTLAHYADGRACAVSLRTTSRIIHVSWSEYMAPED